MKIRITLTLDRHDCRAITQSMGEQQPASSAVCRTAMCATGAGCTTTKILCPLP